MVKFTEKGRVGTPDAPVRDIDVERYSKYGKGLGQIRRAHDISQDEIETILRSDKYREQFKSTAPKEVFTPYGVMDENFVIKLCGLGKVGTASRQQSAWGPRGRVIAKKTGHHEVYTTIDTRTGKPIPFGTETAEITKDPQLKKYLGSVTEYVPCIVKSKGKGDYEIIDAADLAVQQELLADLNLRVAEETKEEKYEEELRRTTIRAKGRGKKRGKKGGSTLGTRLFNPKTGELIQASPSRSKVNQSNIEIGARILADANVKLDPDLMAKNERWKDLYNEYRKMTVTDTQGIDTALPQELVIKLSKRISEEKDSVKKKALSRQFMQYTNAQLKRNAELKAMGIEPHDRTFTTGDISLTKGRSKPQFQSRRHENETQADYKLRVLEHERKYGGKNIGGLGYVGTMDTCMRCGGNVGYDKRGRNLQTEETPLGMFSIHDDAQLFGGKKGGRPKEHMYKPSFFNDDVRGPDIFEVTNKGIWQKMPTEKRAVMRLYCEACESEKGYLETVSAPKNISHPRFGKVKKGTPMWQWTDKLLTDFSAMKFQQRENEDERPKEVKRYKSIDKRTGNIVWSGPVAVGGGKAGGSGRQGRTKCGECKKVIGKTQKKPGEPRTVGFERVTQYVLGRGAGHKEYCNACYLNKVSFG